MIKRRKSNPIYLQKQKVSLAKCILLTKETFMIIKKILLYEAIIILLILIIPPIRIAKLTPHAVGFTTLSGEFLLLLLILAP